MFLILDDEQTQAGIDAMIRRAESGKPPLSEVFFSEENRELISDKLRKFYESESSLFKNLPVEK